MAVQYGVLYIGNDKKTYFRFQTPHGTQNQSADGIHGDRLVFLDQLGANGWEFCASFNLIGSAESPLEWVFMRRF
jgi:hypothetical protein